MKTDNPLIAAIMLIKIFYDNYMDFDGNVLICELAREYQTQIRKILSLIETLKLTN